jgi:hypothetical protein
MLARLLRVSLLGVVCLSCGALANRDLAQTVATASEIEVEAAAPAGTHDFLSVSAFSHNSVYCTQ